MSNGAATQQAQQQGDSHAASITQQRVWRGRGPVWLLVAAACTAGCQDAGLEHRLEDFHGRVSHVLEVDSHPVQIRPVPAYPRRRLRRVAAPELRLSPGEALRFRGCLGRELGERNSILGQVMQPSIRLAYETRVAAALQDCAPETAADQALLERIRQVKSRSLQVAGYDLLFASEEVESFLGVAARPASMDELRQGLIGTQALSDLAALVRRGGEGEVLTPAELAAALRRLRESRQAAGLIRAARLFEAQLAAIAATIHQRLDARALCLQPRPTPKARVAETVFYKFYVQQIQPDLGVVQRALAALERALDQALAATTTEPTGALVAYVDAVHSVHHQLLEASRAHARAWQRLLGQCGRMPDRSDSESGT